MRDFHALAYLTNDFVTNHAIKLLNNFQESEIEIKTIPVRGYLKISKL